MAHFSCVAVVFLLPIVLPQPEASITSGDHWYWGFLESTERLFFWLTLPVSCFMSHPRDSGLWLFEQPITEATFVPFCIVLALNSLLIGYAVQLVVRRVRRPRAANTTEGNEQEFRKLLNEHRREQP